MSPYTLCLGECDREQTVEVIRTSIKDASASWVEEAKKEMKKAAEEIIGDAKKRMENSAGTGSRSWADKTEESSNIKPSKKLPRPSLRMPRS